MSAWPLAACPWLDIDCWPSVWPITFSNTREPGAVGRGPFDDLLNRLLRGDLDILVGALRNDLTNQPISQVPLFQSALCWVAGPGHPLLRQSSITVSDLMDYRLWINRPGTPMRKVFEAQFSSNGMALPTKLIESSAHEVMLGLLRHTPTVAMVSRHMVASELAEGRLVQLPLPVQSGFRDIGYTVRDNYQLPRLRTTS